MRIWAATVGLNMSFCSGNYAAKFWQSLPTVASWGYQNVPSLFCAGALPQILLGSSWRSHRHPSRIEWGIPPFPFPLSSHFAPFSTYFSFPRTCFWILISVAGDNLQQILLTDVHFLRWSLWVLKSCISIIPRSTQSFTTARLLIVIILGYIAGYV